MMKNHGLFLVFIGIEDGTDEGLKWLNKHMTVAKCLKGIRILKKIGIEFDFGFMLFQPSSTFKSINDNLEFLKKITSDGYTTLIFTKLQPYFETQVEKELKLEGRLKGNIGLMSYDYQDKSLNQYYDFIENCFGEWLQGTEGIVNILKWARNYFSVYSRYYDNSSQVSLLRQKVRRITTESNLFAYNTMKGMIKFFESGKSVSETKKVIRNLKRTIDSRQEGYKKKIKDIITELYYMSPEYMHL